MKRPPEDVVALRMEHEALCSTLAEAENLVPAEVMTALRGHYLEAIMAARAYPQGYGA